MPAGIRIVHRFAERYGWTPDVTQNLPDELRDGLLVCIQADAAAGNQTPDTRELEWLAEAVREIEAEAREVNCG